MHQIFSGSGERREQPHAGRRNARCAGRFDRGARGCQWIGRGEQRVERGNVVHCDDGAGVLRDKAE
jgi:hypothetical protein